MENIKKIDTNTLLNNDDFIAWVISGNKKNNLYWEQLRTDLKGVEKDDFDKSEKIIQSIRALNIDKVDVKTPEFIQQQYIKLLETKSVNPIAETKVFKLSNLMKYAAAIILLISLSGIYYYTATNANSFKEHLTESNFNDSEILLQTSNGDFFNISNTSNNKWITSDGVFVSVDANKISFIATDDIDPDAANEFKLIVPKGERYHVTLIDGTEVELNENSTLSFSNIFHSTKRKVGLNGEAFFDVTHHKSRPFIVQSSGVQIEVLGTEFNVSNYKENDFVRATLINGSIKISNVSGEKKILQPGEQATIYHNESNINVQQADIQETVAWIAGRLIFKDEKLEKLITRLNQWYGVDFILSGEEIKQMRFTGTLKKENDLIYFLQMLKYTEGISYEINNEQVRLFVN